MNRLSSMQLNAAERDGFEVLVSGDQGMERQQNSSGRTLARAALSAQEWRIIKEHLDVLAAAVDRAEPGSHQYFDCGKFSRGEE